MYIKAILKGMKQMRNKEKKKESGKDVIRTNKDILPIKYFDKNAHAYVLNDGSYITFVEILTKDIPNLLDDEIQRDELIMAKFYKMFNEVKMITLNFPTNTTRQRKFLEKKFEQTNSPVRKKWLLRSIDELELQDKNTTKREFYFCIYAKSISELTDKMNLIASCLGFGMMGLAKRVSDIKKHQIMFKLCNMNSLVISEEE